MPVIISKSQVVTLRYCDGSAECPACTVQCKTIVLWGFSSPSIKAHFGAHKRMLHFIIFTTPAPIDMDTESGLPYFLWSRSKTCGVGLNVGYCYSRVRAGILGVSIAFRRGPSWPGHKSLLLHAASRPISATLIFNTSITWLCSLKVSEGRK